MLYLNELQHEETVPAGKPGHAKGVADLIQALSRQVSKALDSIKRTVPSGGIRSNQLAPGRLLDFFCNDNSQN